MVLLCDTSLIGTFGFLYGGSRVRGPVGCMPNTGRPQSATGGLLGQTVMDGIDDSAHTSTYDLAEIAIASLQATGAFRIDSHNLGAFNP